MKAKMVELIKNYNMWYGLQYEICYFFNVYGPGQIMSGDYATVVGIFERQWRAGDILTVVHPGTQTRDFTHVDDIVDGVLLAAQQHANHEWHLRSGKSWTIIEVAELFTQNWHFIPERPGERQRSAEIPNDTQEKLDWQPTKSLGDWVRYII
jgi:UDP-glucose 4-epimerase